MGRLMSGLNPLEILGSVWPVRGVGPGPKVPTIGPTSHGVGSTVPNVVDDLGKVPLMGES